MLRGARHRSLDRCRVLLVVEDCEEQIRDEVVVLVDAPTAAGTCLPQHSASLATSPENTV